MADNSRSGRADPASSAALRGEDFQLFADSVVDYAIFMLDPAGRVASWNLGAQRLKGYQADEIIGRHFSAFYSAEDVAAGKPERELAIARSLGRLEDEGWRVRSDGSLFWANVIITAVRNDTGDLRGFAKVTRDLTERRRAEEERLSLARAESALRLRDEFLSIASHELRTPLNALLLHAAGLDFAIRNAASSDTAAPAAGLLDRVASIARQGARLNELIGRLLDVSRLATGRLAIKPEPMDLVGVVSEVVGTYQPEADRAGVEVRLSTPPSIPGVWDPLRVSQIVTNLLSNALKYGGGRPVDVTVETNGDRARVAVRDRGIGIARENWKHIFDRFDRADAPRDTAGLGLGLYIVDRLARAHGGSVALDSVVGQGSTFSVELPLGLDPHRRLASVSEQGNES
jgi:PAS domain S-box-containing protein